MKYLLLLKLSLLFTTMRYIITESQLSIIKEQIVNQGQQQQKDKAGNPLYINGKRRQSVSYQINDLQKDFLEEALVNNSKKVPVYISKVRPGALVQLQGLGLKSQNNTTFFKKNLDNMDLTNTFTTRMYFLNGIGKDGIIDVIDNTFYLGCGKTETTAEEMLNSVRQGKCNNISYKDGETTKTKLVDIYVSLRQMVDAKNLVALLSRVAKVNDNVMAVNYLMNFLNDSANPEDVYVGDNTKDQADEWGVTPNKKYSPAYEELKKLYTPELTK